MVVGGQGTVLPGSRNNIRSRADGSATQLGQIWPGEVFTVTGTAVCAGGLQWWPISFNGISGWTAAGDAANQWIEMVGTGDSSVPIATPNHQGDMGSFNIRLANGDSFVFLYDRSRNLILNGTEFVVSELRKIDSVVQSSPNIGTAAYNVFLYAVPIAGTADNNKSTIEETICQNDSSCRNGIRYQVGDRQMDLSGVGNIVYGFYIDSIGFPIAMNEMVAGWDQLLSSLRAWEYITIRDNPDDIMQHRVGRELANVGISIQNLNELANDLGLF